MGCSKLLTVVTHDRLRIGCRRRIADELPRTTQPRPVRRPRGPPGFQRTVDLLGNPADSRPTSRSHHVSSGPSAQADSQGRSRHHHCARVRGLRHNDGYRSSAHHVRRDSPTVVQGPTHSNPVSAEVGGVRIGNQALALLALGRHQRMAEAPTWEQEVELNAIIVRHNRSRGSAA